MSHAHSHQRLVEIHRSLAEGSLLGALLGERPARPGPRLVFPGAFHPLHDGHRRMADIASDLLSAELHWELSLVNVDKQPISLENLQVRVAQFADPNRLWITCAATFLQKVQLFPGAAFVVGADTVQRIGDLSYYGGRHSARTDALEQVRSAGCRFIVFGRVMEGQFRVLSDLHLPPPLDDLCQEVPANQFRLDMSSTELRKARSSQARPGS